MTISKVTYFISRIVLKIFVTIFTIIAYFKFYLHGVKVGKGLQVSGLIKLDIHWRSKVVIGNYCKINSGYSINSVAGYQRTSLVVGPGARLVIGDKVGISNSAIVCLKSVEINDHAYIGGGCKIYDTDFHSINPEKRGTLNDVATNKDIVIGKDSFIGAHSIILKGVSVGAKSVIGAGSVVTKSIPDAEIWAGNSAKFIRKL